MKVGFGAFDASPAENETPTALAGATGADAIGYIYRTAEYRNRANAATSLCHAIADCHPDDACEIMGAALEDLRAGGPIPALFGIMGEATFWASLATRVERKAYALASFLSLPATDRVGFLAYVQGVR